MRCIKEDTCYVAFNPKREEHIEQEGNTERKDYKLPDGRIVSVGAERFRAPEILFNPSIVGTEYGGVHECLANAISRLTLISKNLILQIVLAGGSTMFPGYGDRLLNEVRRLAQASSCTDVKIRISAPPNRKFMTWSGGSILASLAAFKTMWVSKAEYEEVGALAIHKKTL